MPILANSGPRKSVIGGTQGQIDGKFWAHPSDSESEIDEDLGIVEGNPQVNTSLEAGSTYDASATNQIPRLSQQAKDQKLSKFHRQANGYWPWNGKKGWKGPLPKPRCSPMRTLCDILMPKLIEAQCRSVTSSPASLPQKRMPNLVQQRQTSNMSLAVPSPLGLSNTVGQITTDWSRRNPGLTMLQRRLR